MTNETQGDPSAGWLPGSHASTTRSSTTGEPAGTSPGQAARTRAAIGSGVVVGVVSAALPLLFWWLPDNTVYAVVLAIIASIYVGFAVADGRTRVIVVESVVALAFVTVAAVALADFAGAGWLLVAGTAGHGLKDFWQHRTHFVSTTRWWPPFCAAVDWVAAAIIAVVLLLA